MQLNGPVNGQAQKNCGGCKHVLCGEVRRVLLMCLHYKPIEHSKEDIELTRQNQKIVLQHLERFCHPLER